MKKKNRVNIKMRKGEQTLRKLNNILNRKTNFIPISLLHVPSIIRSSIRNICRPGNPLAHPRPVKSRNTDAWLYGLYSYACVPLPPLKPIYKIQVNQVYLVKIIHIDRETETHRESESLHFNKWICLHFNKYQVQYHMNKHLSMSN